MLFLNFDRSKISKSKSLSDEYNVILEKLSAIIAILKIVLKKFELIILPFGIDTNNKIIIFFIYWYLLI